MTKYRIKEHEGCFTVQKKEKVKFWQYLLAKLFLIEPKRWSDVYLVYSILNFKIATYSNIDEAKEKINELINEDREKPAIEKPKYHYYPEEKK
jgi:hypothetical protein